MENFKETDMSNEFNAYVDEQNLQPAGITTRTEPEYDDIACEQEALPVTANVTHSIEMDQYFFAIEMALRLADGRLGRSKSDAMESITHYFIDRQAAYGEVAPINPCDKKYPIFAGYVSVDIPLARKYAELYNNEIAEEGMPSGNGAAALFFHKNDILYFEKDISELLTCPEFYLDLREEAYASYVARKPKRKKAGEVSPFDRRLDLLKTCLEANKSLVENANLLVRRIYNIIHSEITEHLNKFSNEKYIGVVLELSDLQRVILTFYFLEIVGMSTLRTTDVARFMESVFGGKAATYRGLITKCTADSQRYTYSSLAELRKSLQQIKEVFGVLKGNNHDQLMAIIGGIEGKTATLTNVIERK